jgi:hypothetical protein
MPVDFDHAVDAFECEELPYFGNGRRRKTRWAACSPPTNQKIPSTTRWLR